MNEKELFLNNVLISMRAIIDKNALQILEQTIIRELQNREFVEKQTMPSTIDDTNAYIINLFMAKKAPKLSPKTVEQYIYAINCLIDTLHKPLTQMDTFDIECFLQHYKTYGKAHGKTSNVSVNNIKRNISAMFTWMRRENFIYKNPCENVDPYKEIQKPIDHMTPEEVEQLKTGCKTSRDRALIEFLRCTAMRREEIPCVNTGDVDWMSGKITIFGQKSQSYRLVCLDGVAIHYLQLYLCERGITDNNVPLFTVHNSTKALSKDGIYASVKEIAKRAGMKRNIYPHLFRKTTATNIIKRGGSEEAAGEYLGHKPKSVTGRHYAFKSEDHVLTIFKQYVAQI